MQQIALGLLGAVFDGVEHLRIDAGDLCEHACVVLVTLSIAGVDRTEFARVGDEHLVVELCEEAFDPGAVGTHFKGNARSWILLRETAQGFAMIRNGALVDDFAVLVQNTQGVLLIAEIETYLSSIALAKEDGDEWYFRFHGSDIVSQRSRAASHCLLI